MPCGRVCASDRVIGSMRALCPRRVPVTPSEVACVLATASQACSRLNGSGGWPRAAPGAVPAPGWSRDAPCARVSPRRVCGALAAPAAMLVAAHRAWGWRGWLRALLEAVVDALPPAAAAAPLPVAFLCRRLHHLSLVNSPAKASQRHRVNHACAGHPRRQNHPLKPPQGVN